MVHGRQAVAAKAARGMAPGSRGAVRARAGFTLIELMVALVIASIVLAAGIPALRDMVSTNRLAAASNAMLSSLMLARSEAAKRGARATVCKSDDGAQCCEPDGDCDEDAVGWEIGWIVFADTDADAVVDGPGEEILLHHEALPEGMTFSGNANVADYVSFLATGPARLTSGGLQMGTLTLCDTGSGEPGAQDGRTVTINRTGRAAVAEATC